MINRTLIARIQSYYQNWFQDTNWSDEDVLDAIAIAKRVESGEEKTYSFEEAMEDLELTGELGLVTRTERGFEVIDFQDLYNKECSLQQSSLAVYWEPGTSAVWLGQGEDRMHLGEEQVQSLVTVLQRWLDTGSFIPYPTTEVSPLSKLAGRLKNIFGLALRPLKSLTNRNQ
jgi:hypothetical protein